MIFSETDFKLPRHEPKPLLLENCLAKIPKLSAMKPKGSPSVPCLTPFITNFQKCSKMFKLIFFFKIVALSLFSGGYKRGKCVQT